MLQNGASPPARAREHEGKSLKILALGHGTEAATSSHERIPESPGAIHGFQAEGGKKGMKLITAVVRPHCLEDVRMAVARMGLGGLTATEIEQHDVRLGRTEVYRGAEYRTDWEPRIRIELAVEDEVAEQVTEAICNVARTGRREDGDVFVSVLAGAIRIRTGETGPFAT